MDASPTASKTIEEASAEFVRRGRKVEERMSGEWENRVKGESVKRISSSGCFVRMSTKEGLMREKIKVSGLKEWEEWDERV